MVRLIDVCPANADYPDGYAYPVCEGMQRMSYRDGGDAAAPAMVPGEVYRICIRCFPAANRFAPGHRLRVDVFSSNFPRYEINRNTSDPEQPGTRVAHNSIHHDREFPSCVLLPVLPAE
jgi:putative CocE/NonD family hydrolase